MSTSDSIKAAASGETAPGTLSEGATTDAMILAALDKLDPTDDAQWTEAGKPAMDAVNALLPASITRKRLEEVAPDFARPTDAPASNPEPFGGEGDHDGNGTVGGAAPPVDNDHVADGATQFSDAEGAVNAVGDNEYADMSAAQSDEAYIAYPTRGFGPDEGIPVYPEDRIAALEADLAFLRKQFGWPTKDA